MATLLQKIQELKTELVDQVKSGRADLDALQTRVNELTAQHQKQVQVRLVDRLQESKDFQAFLKAGANGKAKIELEGADVELLTKATLTESGAGFPTFSGVLGAERLAGITSEPRQALMVENLLASDTTTQVQGMVFFDKATSVSPGASPQTEGGDLGENAVTFTPSSELLQNVGCWIPMSRQIADDMSDIANFVISTLGYYTNLRVEVELLSGTGTEPHLHGLIPQASLADFTLLPQSGWNMLDAVSCAIEQLGIAKELPATFAIVNSVDWAKARRLKASTGGSYLYGEPSEPADTLWGLTVCPTTSIAAGSFLVGSSSPSAAQVVKRQELSIEFSRSNSDFFTRNKIAVRATRRLALVVRRPGSFIYGSFASSPA